MVSLGLIFRLKFCMYKKLSRRREDVQCSVLLKTF